MGVLGEGDEGYRHFSPTRICCRGNVGCQVMAILATAYHVAPNCIVIKLRIEEWMEHTHLT